MDVSTFAEIEPMFLELVHTVVWCNMSTLDRQNRLRSRVIHPIWEGSTGWLATRPNTLKAKHLAHHPYVSLAYIANIAKPVYVDCRAEWDNSEAMRQHVWDLFLNAPAPLGYDPSTMYPAPTDPGFGVLKFTPWRTEIYEVPTTRLVWHNPSE